MDREPNLAPEFVEALAERTGLAFVSDGAGDFEREFGPEDVFHYIYGVLHSWQYRRRYADFLKTDFARVPLPGGRGVFEELAQLGKRLSRLHLVEAEDLDLSATWCGSSDGVVEKVRYERRGEAAGRVWINRVQYFDGVSLTVWEFRIGGYVPAQKWLKDRKGRPLSDADVGHYRKMVAALAETAVRMSEIDEAIKRRGGWPAAFEAATVEDGETPVLLFQPRPFDPGPEDRYVTCVPLISLQAAAGGFSDSQIVAEENCQWVEVGSGRRLRRGMFVAQIVGRSMEPTIPDGAWCLFRSPVEGTRQGKIVLVELLAASDPETGGRYTVKRYESRKAVAGDSSWSHERIMLKPANREFDPIVLAGPGTGRFRVVAEFLNVLAEPAE